MEHTPKVRGTNKWGILAVTVMSPFMSTLDANIVNVALPDMAQKLHVTTGAVAWVASAYLIALTASILFFGRLGDLKGQTRVLQYGMLFFTIGSFLCSMSKTFDFLIFSRVVQALGASATMATSQGIISQTFPKGERGRALGINGTFVALGMLVGPALGGLIISIAGWPYLFWINVPIGLVTFIAGFILFPKAESVPGKLDLPGALLFAISMVTLFYGIQEVGEMSFTSPLILGCFAAAVITFVLFLITQRKLSEPLLRLGIFRNRWFSISIFCAFTSFAAISVYSIVLPFYLQDVRSMSPQAAGFMMTLYPVLLAVTAPLSGALSDKIGSEGLTLLGLLLTCAGLFLMALLGEGTPFVVMGLFIALMAIGNGLFQSPNTALVMSTLPPDQLGVGGSLNALVRTVGQAFGISGSTAILYIGMSMKMGRRVTDYLPGYNGAFLFGQSISYVVSGAICLLGVLVTALRLYHRKLKKPQTESARNGPPINE